MRFLPVLCLGLLAACPAQEDMVSFVAEGSPLADGTSTAEVRLTVTSASGAPREGSAVRFEVPSPGALSEGEVLTDAAGVASTRVSSTQPGTLTVTATLEDETYTVDVSFHAPHQQQQASALRFEAQPAEVRVYPNAVLRDASLQAIRVTVRDGEGRVVTSSSAQVSIAVESCGAALHSSSLSALAAQDGTASFGGLALGSTGTGCRLRASSTGLAAAVSEPFDVVP